MLKFLKPLLLSAILIPTVYAGSADAQTSFKIKKSRVSFVSDAPLEDIKGRSNGAKGTIKVDPANVSATKGTVTVPVASIKTGIDLRDEHLRSDKWLDAAAHPNAKLEIVSVSGASSLTAGEKAKVTIKGKFTLHGVTKEITAKAQITWDGGKKLRAKAKFSIKLSDFKVKIPKVVKLKVANKIQITVDLKTAS